MITTKSRLDGGLVYSKSLGMFNLNRGSGSCRKTPACKDCYVNRSCTAYKFTKAAWAPGGTDDLNWARCTSEVFEGLERVRLASRGEVLRTSADVKRVAGWIVANPNTLFWIPTRSIYKNRGRDLDIDHMNLITREIANLRNARVIASLDPFTAHHWAVLRDANWSTMFYESANMPKGYEHAGSHPALGKKGSMLHLCSKTWDLSFQDNGRLVGPKGDCATCENGCFELTRVDVWLRNHARAPKNSAIHAKAQMQKKIDKVVDKQA